MALLRQWDALYRSQARVPTYVSPNLTKAPARRDGPTLARRPTALIPGWGHIHRASQSSIYPSMRITSFLGSYGLSQVTVASHSVSCILTFSFVPSTARSGVT